MDIDFPAVSHEFLSFNCNLLVPICSTLFCGVSVAMVFAGASGVPKFDNKDQGVEESVMEKPVIVWLLMNDLKFRLKTSYWFSHMEAENSLRTSKSSFLKTLELNIFRCLRWLEKVHSVRCSKFKEKEHHRFMLSKLSTRTYFCTILMMLKLKPIF